MFGHLLVHLALLFLFQNNCLCEVANDDAIDNIYQFQAVDIDGQKVSFEKYRGNVLLVVNVASECGLTESNYGQLNELYSRYEKDGLRIAAFPCNQFGGQEPADLTAIKQFAAEKSVKFDIYSKIDVNGENTHPIFKFLKSKLSGFFYSETIKWNFTKFLVDSNGNPVKRYGPLHQPKDCELDIIEELHNRNKPNNSQIPSSSHNNLNEHNEL